MKVNILVRKFFYHLGKDGVCQTVNIAKRWTTARIKSLWKDAVWGAGYWLNPFRCTSRPTVDSEKIRDQLKELGIQTHSLSVDLDEYHKYVKKAQYPADYYGGGRHKGGGFEEKTLEHFLSLKCLDVRPDDVLIDVASCASPFSDIVRRLHASTTYKQDLVFPPGTHGNTIGSDAVSMPLLDGFASKLTLHCSFEHFEGERDILFIKEANRILRKGGQLCILPVYFGHFEFYISDPFVNRKGVVWRTSAKTVYVKQFGNRHSYFYSPRSFKERIVENLGRLDLKMFYVENEKEVGATCYCKFIALFTKR